MRWGLALPTIAPAGGTTALKHDSCEVRHEVSMALCLDRRGADGGFPCWRRPAARRVASGLAVKMLKEGLNSLLCSLMAAEAGPFEVPTRYNGSARARDSGSPGAPNTKQGPRRQSPLPPGQQRSHCSVLVRPSRRPPSGVPVRGLCQIGRCGAARSTPLCSSGTRHTGF
jgi:hypothetical protein